VGAPPAPRCPTKRAGLFSVDPLARALLKPLDRAQSGIAPAMPKLATRGPHQQSPYLPRLAPTCHLSGSMNGVRHQSKVADC